MLGAGNVSLWHDRWTPIDFPIAYSNLAPQNVQVKDAMQSPIIMQQLVTKQSVQWSEYVQSVVLNPEREDQLIWTVTTSGEFSSKAFWNSGRKINRSFISFS